MLHNLNTLACNLVNSDHTYIKLLSPKLGRPSKYGEDENTVLWGIPRKHNLVFQINIICEFGFLLACKGGYEKVEWHNSNLLLIGGNCGFTIDTISPSTVNKHLKSDLGNKYFMNCTTFGDRLLVVYTNISIIVRLYFSNLFADQ